MNPDKVKISIVNYFNTLPFRYGLKKSEIISKIDLQEDIPSICAQKLKFGQVDIGLVPVALLPELNNYQIITDYCIGADGAVDSVKLYSQVPLNEIKTITLDYQSRSSITLTKILCKFYWKLDVEFLDSTPGFESMVAGAKAAVVIGDRTFSLNKTFNYEYDLADEWKNFTGLPFVFAAWVSTSEIDPEFIKEFNAALKFGVDNTQKAIDEDTSAAKIENLNAVDYLTKKIAYYLNSEKRKALGLFLEYIGKL